MKLQHTDRGFAHYDFTDGFGEPCTIQKSCLSGGPFIQIGSQSLEVKGFFPHQPWRTITESQMKETFGFQDIIGNNRIYLTQSQVKKLLSILKKFVKTGEID